MESPDLERIVALPSGRHNSTKMTKPTSFCRQLQDMRATWVPLMLLFSVVSVDADYTGVGIRKGGTSFHCEVRFNREVKLWVGTFRTEALAALACDVAFFYINRPSEKFNLESSRGLILENCKPRSAFESLDDWKQRKRFIRAEAKALVNLGSSQNQAPGSRCEDVAESPLVPVRQSSDVIARAICEHFRNQDEQLREFMAWLMRLLNAATQLTHKGRVQKSLQQQREETISQEDALRCGCGQFFDADLVRFVLEKFVEARSGGALWLILIASHLPLLFKIFNIFHACYASLTEQERRQTCANCSAKRQKADQPSSSIELVPDQGDLLSTATLPPFSFPPDLSKQYSTCGQSSLMCVNKSNTGAELVIFNIWTGAQSALPTLLFPRHPVLLHVLVDSATNSYRVIVAGSSRSDEEHLSKKMEVFDSKASEWEELCDIPGPAFGLNEYQQGVSANGILYFISFLEGDSGKGVVAFDVENRKWLPNMTRALPHSFPGSWLQLDENDGQLRLHYEQGGKRCIDVLEMSNSAAEEMICHWRHVVPGKSGRGLQVYPEYTCVGVGEHDLCIFNAIEGEAAVSEASVSLGDQSSNFFSLNPIDFSLNFFPP